MDLVTVVRFMAHDCWLVGHGWGALIILRWWLIVGTSMVGGLPGAIGGLPGVVGGRPVRYPPSHNPPSLTIGRPCHGGRRSNVQMLIFLSENLFCANKHEPQSHEREIRMSELKTYSQHVPVWGFILFLVSSWI